MEFDCETSVDHSSSPQLEDRVYQTMTAAGVPVSSTGQNYSSGQSQLPAANQVQPKTTKTPWSSGLCGCFSDCGNCCATLWCPCITFGQIAEILDKGTLPCASYCCRYTLISFMFGCPCFYSCCYRTKLRQQYLLEGNYCCDCLVHCCCESCALCQEYRELQNQGFDMSLGWNGNIEKRNRQKAMTPMAPVAPVVQEGMTR